MKFFFLLVLIFLPFRLYHLTYPILDAFNFRQAQTATIALNFYKNGINLFQTELDVFGIGPGRFLTLEFPLYEAIVALFYKIFSFQELWGRLVSISFGFLGAWYLYKLVKLVTKKEMIAYLSSFFFLSAPLNMFYQRSFMIEPTVIALLLVGTYYFITFVNNQNNKSYLLALLFLTLGFLHKGLYGPFWLLPMAVYYIKKTSIRQVFSLKFLSIVLIPLGLLFLWQQRVNTINTLSGHTFFTTQSINHLEWNFGFLSDRLSIPDWQFRLQQVLNGVFLKPGLLVFLMSLFVIGRFDKTKFFIFFLLSQIIYFVTLFRIQQQNYYQTVMVPAFAVFMAVGLFYVGKLVAKKINKSASFIFIVLFCSFYVYKSWVNTLPSFYIDWDWYDRLQTFGESVPYDSVGILATPGFDWNSVYSYIPKHKILVVEAEKATPENIDRWKNLGYTFIALHEYEKFPEYFEKVKPGYSLDFLNSQKILLDIAEFKVYQI